MGLSEKRKGPSFTSIKYPKAFNDAMGSQISIQDKVKKSSDLYQSNMVLNGSSEASVHRVSIRKGVLVYIK